MLLVTVAAANSSEEVKTRSGIVGAHLSVAFVGDPLDLNLFPPHVSGVAAGGARGEWQRQRSRMAVVVFISSPKQSSLRLVRGCHTVSLKKKKKKRKEKRQGEGGEEERGSVCDGLLQIMVLFLGAGHPRSG